jgi:hypothetical protein
MTAKLSLLEVEGMCDVFLCFSDHQNTSRRLGLLLMALKFTFVATTA